MRNSAIIFLSKSSSSFTLIELIVVIIIVGILAAVGIDQYSKTVEKSRGSEARINLGKIKKLGYEYWLEHGTLTGISKPYVGIEDGSCAGQIDLLPYAGYPCRSPYYFHYQMFNTTESTIYILAKRCTSGGKSPPSSVEGGLWLSSDFQTGQETWGCGGMGAGVCVGY